MFRVGIIKMQGYDGIKYKSAVAEQGVNILLFDVDESSRVYDIIGLKVYTVDSLDIGVSRMLPLPELETEYLDKD